MLELLGDMDLHNEPKARAFCLQNCPGDKKTWKPSCGSKQRENSKFLEHPSSSMNTNINFESAKSELEFRSSLSNSAGSPEPEFGHSKNSHGFDNVHTNYADSTPFSDTKMRANYEDSDYNPVLKGPHSTNLLSGIVYEVVFSSL